MTRRKLLKVFLAVVAWVESLGSRRHLGRQREALAVPLDVRPDPSSATGTLSREEIETVVAFAEVLVEARPLSPAERAHLMEHIEHRTQNISGYLALYRTTAGLLDRLAQTRFSRLDLRRRTDVMVRHGLVPDGGRPPEVSPPSLEQALAVRKWAIPDLIGGYYASPAGWAVVGYRAFPGRCSNLIRYTRPEG